MCVRRVKKLVSDGAGYAFHHTVMSLFLVFN